MLYRTHAIEKRTHSVENTFSWGFPTEGRCAGARPSAAMLAASTSHLLHTGRGIGTDTDTDTGTGTDTDTQSRMLLILETQAQIQTQAQTQAQARTQAQAQAQAQAQGRGARWPSSTRKM